MSMTFLQMAVRLRQEVGGSGTGPTAVTGQSGEYKRFVDWIVTADEDIQRMHNEWLFMRGSFTLNTVSGTGSYTAADCVTPITDLRDWRKDTFKIYLQSAGSSSEVAMFFIDYQQWYDIYNTGSQTNSSPLYFSIGNDLSLKIAPKPNAVYVISGEYQKSVDTLAASSDVPVYPSEFHMAAVYGAMMKYARYTGAAEIYADAEKALKRIIKEMRRTQLPRTKFGAPLA